MSFKLRPRSLTLPLLAGTLLGAGMLTALVTPDTVMAAESTGTMEGVVLDPGGEPLAYAEVSIESPEMMGMRMAETEEDGRFWFPSLPPGLYTVDIYADGFQPRRLADVRVSIDRSARLEVQMSMPTAGEEITITESRPSLDVESTSSGAVITKEFLEDIPAGRSYQTAAQIAPGVTGGSNPNVRGGSSRENAWLIDGVNISDPVTGTFSVNFNFEAIEEVEVLTGGFEAEYGQAMGGIVNVRTESGGNEFQAKVGANYSNGNWSPRRDAVYTPYGEELEASEFDRDSQYISTYLNVGGPLVRDRAWFFGSYEFSRNSSSALGVEAPRVFQGHNIYAKLTLRPDDAHELVFSALANPANVNNRLQSQFVRPEAEARQAQGGMLVQGQWRFFATDNLIFNNQVTYQKLYLDITGMPCTWNANSPSNQCSGDQPEGFIDFQTPGLRGRAGSDSERNYYYYLFDDRYNASWSGSASLRIPNFLGTHNIKLGGEVRYVWRDYTLGYPGNSYFYTRLEDSNDPSSVVPYYWVEVNGQLHQRSNGIDAAAYLQDTWNPVPNVTISPGVRLDRSAYSNDIGQKIVNFLLVSPRFGFAWDPSRQGRTKLYMHVGQFADAGRLGISGFLDKAGVGYKLYLDEYFDQQTNYSYEQYLFQRAQSNYEFYERETAPRNWQFTLGFEALVWERLEVSVEGTVRLFRHLWEDDEINLLWNDQGTQIIGSQSGVYDDFFRLRTPFEARRDHYAVTVAVEQPLHRNFQVQASYTYSVTMGTTPTHITAAFDNPTQAPFEYGFLGSDRPHVIKVAGSYRFPFDINLGVRYSFSSGSRYDRQYYQDKGGGYANYVSPVGSYDSLAPTHLFNILIAKDFVMPNGNRLEAAVEFNNVFNSRQVTSISTGSLNAEGDLRATSRQSATSVEVRLGYRL